MIKIQRKEECCGCKACGDVCRHGAISFHTDAEGFWYPKVNLEACVECGLCEKVCPVLHPDFSYLENSENPETYVLQAPNLEDRLASASGAAYSLIARAVFEKGGYVAGHIWKDKTNVVGYVSANPKDLDILRGTKYLQSDIEGMFKTVSSLLKENKLVLFSGCPCQVAAMRRFLRKDYGNLITTDFTCMGIDSPLAFAKYIESLESQYGAEMIYFKAKAKDVGWRHLTNKARFANGKSYFGICETDSNLQATFQNVLVRPSCYECKFKGMPRIADITIGDYWRKKYDSDPLDDNTGTSYVILNNAKAVSFFNRIKTSCYNRKVDVHHILEANERANSSLPRPEYNREKFYERIKKEDFSDVVKDYHYKKNTSGFFSITTIKRIIKTICKGILINIKHPVSICSFLYYNFLSQKIKTNILNGDILYITRVNINIAKDAKLIVKGRCYIGDSLGNTSITINKGACLELDTCTIESKSTIFLLPDSKIKVGYRSVLGHETILKVQNSVEIGSYSLLQDKVSILDTDSGVIYFDAQMQQDKKISIGTHSLIEQGSIIKGGTIIGDETIIKSYSIVQGQFEPLSTIAGNPAVVIDNNKCWKYNF